MPNRDLAFVFAVIVEIFSFQMEVNFSTTIMRGIGLRIALTMLACTISSREFLIKICSRPKPTNFSNCCTMFAEILETKKEMVNSLLSFLAKGADPWIYTQMEAVQWIKKSWFNSQCHKHNLSLWKDIEPHTFFHMSRPISSQEIHPPSVQLGIVRPGLNSDVEPLSISKKPAFIFLFPICH